MNRVAIIGNAGGGKSVLARKLAGQLDLPVHPFDDLQWQPGWERAPAGQIHTTHTAWLAQPKWIIDGWGDWQILEARCEAADTIIFVDYPIAVHYWWATKRQIKAALNRNADWPPKGCAALPVTGRLFKLMWHVHTEMRPQLIELMDRHSKNTQIVHLKSPREMKAFLEKIDH